MERYLILALLGLLGAFAFARRSEASYFAPGELWSSIDPFSYPESSGQIDYGTGSESPPVISQREYNDLVLQTGDMSMPAMNPEGGNTSVPDFFPEVGFNSGD